MAVRPGTSDHNTLTSCMSEDEYRLAEIDLGSGCALDVGAHVGGVAISLALDNPDARVIAVECLSANVAAIHENVRLNGVEEQVTVLHRAASSPGKAFAKVEWDFAGTEAGAHHRFIGNAQNISRKGQQSEDVAAIDLAALIEMAGGTVAFCKSDAEGAEYDLFKASAKGVGLIRGEFHAGFARLVALLPTHVVTRISGSDDFGAFEATPR